MDTYLYVLIPFLLMGCAIIQCAIGIYIFAIDEKYAGTIAIVLSVLVILSGVILQPKFNKLYKEGVLHGTFTVIEKSETVHNQDESVDYQYLTLEDGSDGKRYVVKIDAYQGNQYIIGDVVEAKFTAIEYDNRVECSDAIVKPKEKEKTEEYEK